jgi:hypothetical protein
MFRYDAGSIGNVQASLSADRLTKYLAQSGGDPQGALELYVWNASVSAGFYGPLQAFEVALRNAVHTQLTALFGASWHGNAKFLGIDAVFADMIAVATKELGQLHLPIDTPHIVAQLSFGFWTRLFSKKYEHVLWTPVLNRAFPRYPAQPGPALTRNIISSRLNYIRQFRNRIAHHEPIFSRALWKDYESILGICDWMYSDLKSWIRYHCRLGSLLPMRHHF